jgi:hypothetical protein
MVKSLRDDQENCDDSCVVVLVGRVQRAGHIDAYTDLHGNSAPDRHAAPHGHTDARIDLPCAESFGRVGAARSV